MIEVEIKLPVLSLEAVKIQLLALGFQEIGFEKERDTYFDNALGMIRGRRRGSAGQGNRGRGKREASGLRSITKGRGWMPGP